MWLSEKQKRWLRAALLATSREGPVFKRSTLRAWLDLPIDESNEIALSLQREALVTLLPTDEAILTDKGREVARDAGASAAGRRSIVTLHPAGHDFPSGGFRCRVDGCAGGGGF